MANVDHVFLLRELVKRDFQSRYAGSALGFLWAMVQPLWQLLLFTYVFSVVLKIQVPAGARTDSFSVLVFCALIPWIAVQEGISRSATAITDSAELVKKMRFPPELLVLRSTIGGVIQAGFASLVLVVFLLVKGEVEFGSIWVLSIALPLQLALTIGLGLLLSTAHVFFRDTAQVLSVVLVSWFYLTPIIYSLDAIQGRMRAVIAANPLTALVELYRHAFLGGAGVGFGPTVSLLAVASLSLASGWFLFRTFKAAFADEI